MARHKKEHQTGDEDNIDLTRLCIFALLLIPVFVFLDYRSVRMVQRKAKNLITLQVTASDSPSYISETNESGSHYDRYDLKAREFNCHFLITGEPLEIVKDNTQAKEWLESIGRGDSLTLMISAEEEHQLSSLYFKARLFGLTKDNLVLFSPKQLRTLDEDSMNSTLVIAAILEVMIFLALVWRRIKVKAAQRS